LVSQAWKNISDEERDKWEEWARKDKARYEMEKSMYTGPWKVPATKRSQKDPNAPKRPMSVSSNTGYHHHTMPIRRSIRLLAQCTTPKAFLSFSNSKRTQVKEKYPDAGNAEVSRILAQMWKDASTEERKGHVDQEFSLRQEYKIAIARWRKDSETEIQAARKEREDQAMKAVLEGRPLGTQEHSSIYNNTEIFLNDGRMVQHKGVGDPTNDYNTSCGHADHQSLYHHQQQQATHASQSSMPTMMPPYYPPPPSQHHYQSYQQHYYPPHYYSDHAPHRPPSHNGGGEGGGYGAFDYSSGGYYQPPPVPPKSGGMLAEPSTAAVTSSTGGYQQDRAHYDWANQQQHHYPHYHHGYPQHVDSYDSSPPPSQPAHPPASFYPTTEDSGQEEKRSSGITHESSSHNPGQEQQKEHSIAAGGPSSVFPDAAAQHPQDPHGSAGQHYYYYGANYS
jgi:hypothetical protein